MFADFRVVFCKADDGRGFYQGMEIPDTAPFVYLRRHGPKDRAPYSGSYSGQAIRQDAKEISHWLAKRKTVYIYYNNDVGGAAPKDAKRLEEAFRPSQAKVA